MRAATSEVLEVDAGPTGPIADETMELDRRPAARQTPEHAPAIRPAAREAVPTVDAPSEDDSGGDGSDPSGAAPAKKGQQPSKRRYALYGAVVLAALSAAAYGGYRYWDQSIRPFESTDDAFVDSRSFSVAPKVSGYVVEAPVSDNQHVEAGEELFQIDTRDYRIAQQQADAQAQAAEAAVGNVAAQIDAQKAQVEVAKAQVDQSTASLQFAQQDATRYKNLAKTGNGTVQNEQSTSSTLLQRQAALTQAQASVIAAEKNIQSLQAQRASAEAQLAVAKAQADQARLNLAYTHVVAARPGRLVRLTAGVGAFAQAGQSLAMFVPDEVWVTANFKETQLTDMRPGQPVDVEIDAYPDHELHGQTDSVQPGSGTAFSLLPAENATGNYVKVTQRVPVKIVVKDWPRDVAIGPGMSVVPKVRVR